MSWLISKEKYSSFVHQQSSKWKEKGNNSFKARRYDDAIEEYTTALLLTRSTADMPALLSNRSAAYIELGLFQQAMEDAGRSIQIDPSWWRGYLRLACAYVGLGKEVEAVEAISIGVKITKHSGLVQKAKEVKSQPIIELLRTHPDGEPVLVQSPAGGGAIAQKAKRSKNCASMFQWCEQANIAMIRSTYETAKITGSFSAFAVVDAATGQTPLHVAAANCASSPDQLEIIWILIQAGVKIEKIDKLGHTCLTVAAMAGNTIGMATILEFLLSQPQGPLNAQNVLTSCDETNQFDILVHSVLANRKEPVLAMLGDYEYCHLQEARYGESCRNMLHIAAVNGSLDALEALVKLSFDEIAVLVDEADVYGWYPLAYAAANLTRRHMRNGKIPKSFVGFLGSLSTLQVPIEALAQGGANVANVDELSMDARSWSTLICDPRCTTDTSPCQHAEFVVALLETGLVDVNQLQGVGKAEVTPLFLASLFGHVPLVRVLLENGAKQDIGSFTPLQAAASTNNRCIIELLLSFNKDNEERFMMERPPQPNGTALWPDSALTIMLANSASMDEIALLMDETVVRMTGLDLQLALMSKQPDLVTFLLTVGLEPTAETELYGTMTGLATAADLCDMQMMRIMLNYTPSISGAVDPLGRNILHHICENGYSSQLLFFLEELDAHISDEEVRKEELRRLIRPIPSLPLGRASPLELAARQDTTSCFKILQSYLLESDFTKSEIIASALHPSSAAQQTSSGTIQDEEWSAPITTTLHPQSKGRKGRNAKNSVSSVRGKSKGASAASSLEHASHQLNAAHQMGLDHLKQAVSSKLANFVAMHHPHLAHQVNFASMGKAGDPMSDVSTLTDDKLRKKLEALLKVCLTSPDPLPYFKVLHSAQQHKRVSAVLCDLNIVNICLTESLKATNPNILQNWLRTLALLHRSDSPFLNPHTMALIMKLFSSMLFMDTAKAQAYLMVTINNECAAHPNVSSLIVSSLSERENKIPLLRFFICCIKTVQDDEASPAGIGLLDLFTHVFLKDETFSETYRRVIGNLATSHAALNSLISSINNVATKAVDMSASLRMIQRVAQYFPTKVVLAGAVLPLLRICASRTPETNAALTISAYSAFSELLKCSNVSLQRLLWKVMRHSMFIEIGLGSQLSEVRRASCDAIVCLCRDPQAQAQLVADPHYFDLLMKLFGALVGGSNSHAVVESDPLVLRECVIALSFLWNKDPARITAILAVPSALEVLLSLYHVEGATAVASRIIQMVWAHDPAQCQSLVNASPISQKLFQALCEKTGFHPTAANLTLLQLSDPFATPKWHSPSDGVLHEEINGISCAYCGVSETVRELKEYHSKRFCSVECFNADESSANAAATITNIRSSK
jgi:ankyrin repeat protein